MKHLFWIAVVGLLYAPSVSYGEDYKKEVAELSAMFGVQIKLMHKLVDRQDHLLTVVEAQQELIKTLNDQVKVLEERVTKLETDDTDTTYPKPEPKPDAKPLTLYPKIP